MSFSPQQLKLNTPPFSNARVLWVAYSGGCDSHVLLHSLVALRSEFTAEIKAVHINHGLSPLANEWEEHCGDVCKELNVPYIAIKVDASSKRLGDKNKSPEEAARHARYDEWKKLVKQGEVILLAHHQNDQAETVLLQLLRGSGVKGLAAMPMQQGFSLGQLCRPVLNFSREDIQAYAVKQNLKWIDDPSNFDTDFDRNFLRQDVIPLLQTRWPALNKTLSRTATHSAEADQLLSKLAEQDWQLIKNNKQVKIEALILLDEKRQRNVLRYWLTKICKVTLPDTKHLQRILSEVVPAAEDAKPEVIWRGGEVRRHQGLLYAQVPQQLTDSSMVHAWIDIQSPLEVAGITLSTEATVGEGLSQAKLEVAEVTVRFRQGGETCRPNRRGQTHQLKKLFQEWKVPPWVRDSIPLIYIGDEIAEVVGYCHCEPFTAAKGEATWLIRSKLSD